MMMTMGFEISDEFLGTFVPILVYWVYSGMYVCLGSLERYRLHSKVDEDEKNLVTKSAVVKGVLLQQTLQAIISAILFKVSLSPYLSLHSLIGRSKLYGWVRDLFIELSRS